jgi:hypothetical protein
MKGAHGFGIDASAGILAAEAFFGPSPSLGVGAPPFGPCSPLKSATP